MMALVSLVCALMCTQVSEGGTLRVFIMAGQSNMVGTAPVIGLPQYLRETQEDVLFRPVSAPVQKLGPVGNTFGPELTFGRVLADMYPNDKIAIIKYAVGSTGLNDSDDWYPGESSSDPRQGRLYKNLKQRVASSLGFFQSKNYVSQIDGFIWMQGEEDSGYADMANAYRDNLELLYDRVNEDFGNPSFVIGRTRAPYRLYSDIVREAQVDFGRDHGIPVVDTDDLTLVDKLHYDARGFMALGVRFAAVVDPPVIPTPASSLALYRSVPEPTTFTIVVGLFLVYLAIVIVRVLYRTFTYGDND